MNPIDGFPRAEFGLPIVFHFKDEREGDPLQTTLNPYVDGQSRERMASPLILKPLALRGAQAIPIVIPLVTPGVSQVELVDDDGHCLPPTRNMPVRDKRFLYRGSPLESRTEMGSALEAYLTYLKADRDFREVCR